MQFIDDFLQGQQDCQEGKQAKENASDAYNRGYGAEYEMQQIMDAKTCR